MLKPKLLTTLKGYTKQQFLSDLTAGVIVGIVALPLAIAFAIASGVSPEKGLITAVIAGFIISALGGSRVQIGGPTGAFVVIVYSIVQNYGLNGLIISTVMAGVILVIMGLVRFGSVIKFIPHPVVVGFTSGIAVIIFSSQIRDLFGLTMEEVPADFIEKCFAYANHFGTINYYSISIAVIALFIMMFWSKVSRKIPGSLVALIVTTAIVYFFHWPVETIGSRFDSIPSSIPAPTGFTIDFATIKNLIQPATTIALLAAIESLLSAVVADGMIGGKHRSNMELVAQGVANIVTPLFGGIPATGAIARTATNIKNGGRTPVAGMVHAIVLLLIMLFFGKLAELIPLATLAAVLVIVAYNMSEWRTFRSLLKSPRSDVVVLLTTFGLTVIIDLTVAIEIGMVLAVFLFMRRMAMVTNVGVVTRELNDEDEVTDNMAIDKKNVPDGVEVYEINGPFFFGAVEKFKEAVVQIENPPKIMIIRMRNVPAIDSTGLHVLEDILHSSRKNGTEVIFSGVHAQPLIAFENSGLLKMIGEKNIHSNIDEALKRAKEIL
ncbi:MAG: sulfate permease [Ignavibacteriales bacterium]|nr:MAG: sulfate permease [Ignavibacteriales bacterium]